MEKLSTRYVYNERFAGANWLTLRLIMTLVILLVGISFAAVWLISHRWSTMKRDRAVSYPATFKNMTTNQTVTEDYAVYTAALSDGRYIDSSVKLVVIRDLTFRYPSSQQRESEIRHLIQRMSALEGDTLNDYQARNRDEERLSNLFNLKVQSELISGRDIDDLLAKNFIEGWQAIKDKYPDSNGIITLSKVGFNRQTTQALVYVAISCGPHCGEGNFILLSKAKGIWSIQSKLMMNVS